MRKHLYGAVSIYSVFFWLWRIPFVIWLPLPEFGPDTFDYYFIVEAFRDSSTVSYSIDLPMGYPTFVYLIGLVSHKVICIIWLQFFLKYFAGVFLICVCWKYYRWMAVLAAIALGIYVTDSWSLRYDTSLLTESLYGSFLIITIAFLIRSVETPSVSSLVMLSTSMFLVAFTRSNGFFIYFIIPVMLLILLTSGQRILKYSALILPALLLHLLVFGFRFRQTTLTPTEDRVNAVISREFGDLKASSYKSYFSRKLSLASEYLAMPDFPSYYFSLLPERYRQLYELDNIHNPDFKMFDWTTPIPDDFRRSVYSEYYNEPSLLSKNRRMMDVSFSRSHPWFMAIHLTYKIHNFIFRNPIWYILGMALLITGLWIYFRSGFINKGAALLFLLLAVHYVSLAVVVIGHSAMQPRYSHVTEFLLYLAPVFFLMIILPPRSETKN